MKKLLLATLSAGALFASASAATLEMSQSVVGLFDDQGYDVPNYYVILSDQSSATYNQKTGTVALEQGYILSLDLYNVVTDPLALQAGIYRSSSDMTAFTVNPDASELSYYAGGKVKSSVSVTSDIDVSVSADGIYTLTANVTDPETSQPCELKYVGRMPIISVGSTPTSFPMLKHDVENASLKSGGIAYYYGVTDYSNNGVTYLNFYGGAFNQSTGALSGPDGIELAMMIAHKRMNSRDKYTIIPGEYTAATTFARDTWYPCREIQYPDVTGGVPFGSFIRIKENGSFVAYGYLKSGTFTIDFDPESKHLTGTLDAYTDLGYHVTATLEGDVAYDFSLATFNPAISNLEDDVDLDLDYLEQGRIFHLGEKGGCRSFIVDLGSPAGTDSPRGVAADLMRIEFLMPQNEAVVKPGLYTVVPRRWNENELKAGGTYEPMSIGKGSADHGTSSSPATIGSCYAHFQEGLTYVFDYFAPVDEGTVRVSTQDYINYTFDIHLLDDAGFEIRGLWENKPLEYRYDREALAEQLGVESVASDDDSLSAVVEGRNIIVLNAGDAPVALFDLNGRQVLAGNAATVIDASSLAGGVYLLNVSGKALKVVLK